jgi:hypothetical protein
MVDLADDCLFKVLAAGRHDSRTQVSKMHNAAKPQVRKRLDFGFPFMRMNWALNSGGLKFVHSFLQLFGAGLR